jgi:hypothetical protein
MSMSEPEPLKAQLAERDALLALAENIILAYRSGLVPVEAEAEGVWGREEDKAGLREVLRDMGRKRGKDSREEDGSVGSGGKDARAWGKTIWIDANHSAGRNTGQFRSKCLC